MKGTQVRSLIGEDLLCCGATKPECRNYDAYAPRALLYNKISLCNEKSALQ